MTPVIGILVLAGLFTAFGVVFRGREHRPCHGCTPDLRGNSCSICPLHEVGHD